ncbi:hypothetical protein A2U01_0053420, partial [Trifolium medium]|nr:hypothetical protein [Trifolium medium]
MSCTALRTAVFLLGAVVYACFGPRVVCFMRGFAFLLARMVIASVSGGLCGGRVHLVCVDLARIWLASHLMIWKRFGVFKSKRWWWRVEVMRGV